MVRYLSLAWIDALTEVPTAANLPRRRHHKISVTQVVTDGPEGNVITTFLGDGTARARTRRTRGCAEQSSNPHRMATGHLNARGLHQGLIRLTGNQQKSSIATGVRGARRGVHVHPSRPSTAGSPARTRGASPRRTLTAEVHRVS